MVPPSELSLVAVLSAHAPSERVALEALVPRRMAEARAAWPGLTIDEGVFGAHLLGCVPEGSVSLAAALEAMRFDDVYLAFACAQGDARALSTFARAFAPEYAAVASQVQAARVSADDLAQMLAARLFSQPEPKIRDYTGQGKLRNWVRVAAVRMCVDASRKQSGRERPMAPEQVPEVVDVGADPELAFLKREHREQMRAAFEEAAGELSPEDRNLLRHHHTRGMSIDQLAAAHGIHRATAARRLQRARELLLEGTRRRLMERLRISESELDSVVRAAESQFHVTLERVLRSVT